MWQYNRLLVDGKREGHSSLFMRQLHHRNAQVWHTLSPISQCYLPPTCLPGGLSYDEPKANSWHPLVWICYERGCRHPLTSAVHKWSRIAYVGGATTGCSCPPSPISLRHVTTGLRTVWHLEETTRSSAKMMGRAGHYEHRALLLTLGVLRRLVSMEGATTRRRSRVERIERVWTMPLPS